MKTNNFVDDSFGYKYKLMDDPAISVSLESDNIDSIEGKISRYLMSRLVSKPESKFYKIEGVFLDFDEEAGVIVCRIQSGGSFYYFSLGSDGNGWAFDKRYIFN